ncbi:hypothetical protein, partial [Mesorhizobium sp.]|uniref:hypothetical protein n=1 Tax=Mesorhizobium sp. TaxID=1871066 RepID=UPI00257A5A20
PKVSGVSVACAMNKAASVHIASVGPLPKGLEPPVIFNQPTIIDVSTISLAEVLLEFIRDDMKVST